ncbi:MAG: hypothetical protein H7318_06255 [Oligoflexus sp.]|nr:hypothetical protein [Oligoflexus sp.]
MKNSFDPHFCLKSLKADFASFRAKNLEGLYIYEKALDLNGRNALNVLPVRHVDSRQMCGDIRCLATIMLQKWSKATKLGAAAFCIDGLRKIRQSVLDGTIKAGRIRRSSKIRKNAGLEPWELLICS